MRIVAWVAVVLVLVTCGCGGGGSKATSSTAGATTTAPTHATVHVYFCTAQTCAAAATQKEIDQVRSKLESNSLVQSVKFVSREGAFAQMKKRHPNLARHVKSNPLPNALVVTAHAGDARAVAESLSPAPPGVQAVRY